MERRDSTVGEFIEIGAYNATFGLISGLFCAGALGIFALMQDGAGDDDDSNGGGGGLMQPIS